MIIYKRFSDGIQGRYSQSIKRNINNPTNVIYRSLWERKFMKWCDLSESVIKWGSEETVVPCVTFRQ